MAEVVRDPDGKLWEKRGGRWYEVGGARAGGMLEGADMSSLKGVSEGVLEGFRGFGGGIHKAIAGALGDKEWAKRIDAERAEQAGRVSGLKATGPAWAIGGGEIAPSLATLPIGMGIGGLATRGAAALGEQVLLGAGMGGLAHSGDQGLDAMTGALLAAGGWGTGQLAGKVVGMIGERGVRARAAIMEAADAPGRAAAVGGGGLVGAADEITQAAGGGGAPLHLGQAAGPVGADVAGGVSLPGMVPVAGAAGLREEAARQIARGKEIGFRFTPGQEAGDVAQQQLEASAKSSPWARRFFEPLMRNNEDVLNKTAVRALGEEGDAVTQQVLNSAHIRLGEVFESVAGGIGTVKGAPLAKATAALEAIVEQGKAGGQITPEVVREARQLLKVWKESGEVTGERLLSERTAQVQLSRDLPGQNKGLAAQGIRKIIGVIDDLMEGSIPASERSGMRETLREARGQWRILTALESGASLNPNGSVRAGSLYSALQREFPMEMRRGNFETVFGGTKTGAAGRDLMDAVRITQTFRDVVSDSGTATRMSLQGLLSHPLQAIAEAAIVGGGSKLYLKGGGLLAHELGMAPNAAPGATGAAGGVMRGLMGGF